LRSIGDPVPGGVKITKEYVLLITDATYFILWSHVLRHNVVIFEGIYLIYDESPWDQIAKEVKY